MLKENKDAESDSQSESQEPQRDATTFEEWNQKTFGSTDGNGSPDEENEQSNTEGDPGQNTDEDDGETDDQDKEPSDDESDEDEKEDESDETEDENDDEEVVLPETVGKFLDMISGPDEAKQAITKELKEAVQLKTASDALLAGTQGIMQWTELAKSKETLPAAMDVLLDFVADQNGMTRDEVLAVSNFGVQRSAGDGPVLESLAEDKIEGFVDKVLETLEFDPHLPEQKDDAKNGALAIAKAIRDQIGALLPQDYHQWKKEHTQNTELERSKSEAATVAKQCFSTVAAQIAKEYGGYKITEDLVREAMLAVPQLAKDKKFFEAVVATHHKRLNKFVMNRIQNRDKKRMPETPKKGEQKPTARKTLEYGKQQSRSINDFMPTG